MGSKEEVSLEGCMVGDAAGAGEEEERMRGGCLVVPKGKGS